MLNDQARNNGEKLLSGTTREVLFRHRFTPKKKLGQNFIIDAASLERMIAAGDIKKNDLVIEIGTGLGTLTNELAKRSDRVVSIEYDKILFEIAKENLQGHKNIELIRDDFLKLDLEKLLKKEKGLKPYKVIANLPYYITAPIMTKLIETVPIFSLAVLTVQKEVGERITAVPGTREYGTLSIYVQNYIDVTIDSHIPRSAFYPHPTVSSSILVLKPRSEPLARVKNEKLFFRVVHAAFEHRRKTLRNSIIISRRSNISKERLDCALELSGMDGGRRGETLSIGEFAMLANALA
jgi:16S rRNA (adenine1518-N6/adenine1519-N6)-dimethyltransferase